MRQVFLDSDGTIGDWLGVVVAAPTGVCYELQGAGVATVDRSLEGYYVPVGGIDAHSPTTGQLTRAPGWEDFRRFFLGRVGIESPREGPARWRDPSALDELRELVGRVPWWTEQGETKRYPLALDEERLAEIIEAWVPVTLGEDGRGVLVWANSD